MERQIPGSFDTDLGRFLLFRFHRFHDVNCRLLFTLQLVAGHVLLHPVLVGLRCKYGVPSVVQSRSLRSFTVSLLHRYWLELVLWTLHIAIILQQAGFRRLQFLSFTERNAHRSPVFGLLRRCRIVGALLSLLVVRGCLVYQGSCIR